MKKNKKEKKGRHTTIWLFGKMNKNLKKLHEKKLLGRVTIRWKRMRKRRRRNSKHIKSLVIEKEEEEMYAT